MTIETINPRTKQRDTLDDISNPPHEEYNPNGQMGGCTTSAHVSRAAMRAFPAFEAKAVFPVFQALVVQIERFLHKESRVSDHTLAVTQLWSLDVWSSPEIFLSPSRASGGHQTV